MKWTRSLQQVGFAPTLALIAFGCSPASSPPPTTTPPAPVSNDPRSKLTPGVLPIVDRTLAADDLRQIGVFYLTAGAERGPANLEDMADLKRKAPKFYQALQEKRYLLYWNANLSASGASETVLGYERDAPAKGGVVLMLDGTTRSMSADEFKTASKAGPEQ